MHGQYVRCTPGSLRCIARTGLRFNASTLHSHCFTSLLHLLCNAHAPLVPYGANALQRRYIAYPTVQVSASLHYSRSGHPPPFHSCGVRAPRTYSVGVRFALHLRCTCNVGTYRREVHCKEEECKCNEPRHGGCMSTGHALVFFAQEKHTI